VAQEIVEAPIVGKVLRVNVNSGDKVEEGDVVCEIESMKMENPIMSPVSGVINDMKVSPGQVVKAGEVLAIIEC
jgi:biotin carboxyl carrier protein